MTPTTDASETLPASSDPRAAGAVAAFRGALIRMRDGQELTVDDLDTTVDLLRMVQAPAGESLAAAAMPQFREVFHAGHDSAALPGRAETSTGTESTDVLR
ncbi:hypothetical protein [Streptomyces sp. SID13726]|uniref:hypothetical protein n=1 Tax=Streptomyces sp. SID13726 TaxID=2706058 RepID=UPI0013BD89BD|nr:hypothetical protein [Streptomyces sp. SID13726]NEB00422.1 hypothetical protein [Streptomyces sp. SID13726]